MGKLYLTVDMGVPQIGCTDCSKCCSLMGKSLCGIKNRGCCHYFPEFSLVELQRMAVLEGGRKALDAILSKPGTVINNYSIYAKGSFDSDLYNSYINSGYCLETGDIKDHTIFFRTCPMVESGKGCTLPPRFRTTVCNFFICQEIIGRPDTQHLFKGLLEERSRYVRWVYRENGILEHILSEEGLDLKKDLNGSLELLSQIEQSYYDFPYFDPIEYIYIGASEPDPSDIGGSFGTHNKTSA